jgi:hypothetical protein
MQKWAYSFQEAPVSLKHKDHHAYMQDLGPRLHQLLEKERDLPFESAVSEGMWLCMYWFEDFEKKMQKNKVLWPKLGMLLLATVDAVRGVLSGQAELSILTVATLARVILEMRFNFTFIVTRDDPAKYADWFVRFESAQRLQHDERGPKRLFSEQERAKLLEQGREWIRTGKDGVLQVESYWFRADKTLGPRSSLGTIAKKCGLGDDYHQVYGSTSKFVHGNTMMRPAYRGEKGNLMPVGQPLHCKRFSFLGTYHAVETMSSACTFFEVPADMDAKAEWRHRLIEASRDALGKTRSTV